MTRTLRILALIAALIAPSAGFAQSNPAWTVASCPATLGFAAGVWRNFAIDLGGNLCIAGTITVTPSGTQDVNLTKVGGAAVATGNGTAAGSIRVALPTDGTGVVGLNAGTSIIGKVGIDQTTAVTTNGVIIAPSSSAAAGIAPNATQAAASNSVFKSGAGNLYTVTVAIGATSGWLMIFDATALPSNGATGSSLKYCYPILSNGTTGGATFSWSSLPLGFLTGITVGFSSTTCNSLTASATAFFYGQVQ